MFGPIRLPPEVFSALFEEVEPVITEAGKKLHRYRLKGTDNIFQEDAWDATFTITNFQRKPLELRNFEETMAAQAREDEAIFSALDALAQGNEND